MPLCPRGQRSNPDSRSACQGCGAPLTAAGQDIQAPLAVRGTWAPRLLTLVGGLVAAGVIGFLASSLGYTSSAPSSAPSPAQPAAPAGTPLPSAPTASLPEQVQVLFNTLREAQLKKDLTLLLSCYSPSFPGLAEKRQQTQKAWEEYTFTNMFYFLDEVTPQGPDQAKVRVTWELQAQPRTGGETLTATQVFQVELKREGSAWKIAGLQELPAP